MFAKILGKGMTRLHGNHAAYWEYQTRVAKEILFPQFAQWNIPIKDKRVLEIGMGNGGIIHAFADADANVAGVELDRQRVENNRQFFTKDFPIIFGDFCTEDILQEIGTGQWDLILVRDVLEHLLDKEVAMRNLKRLLAPGGAVFFDFPPWYFAFGGHQQAMQTFLRYVPFLHWLPRRQYSRFILWSEMDRPKVYQGLMETYDAQITLRQFHKLLKRHDMILDKHKLFMLNPSYRVKFGWPTIELKALGKLPLIPEVLATNIYALVKNAD